MSEEQRMVAEFHRAFSIPVETVPCIPDEATYALRLRLLQQECETLHRAFTQHDLTVAAQALADLLYAVYGTALTCGLEMAPVFHEVHRSNMTKVGVRQRDDGTWVRPPGYTPPCLEPILAAQAHGQSGARAWLPSPTPVPTTTHEVDEAQDSATPPPVAVPPAAAPVARPPRPAAHRPQLYGSLRCPRCHKNFIRRAHRLGFGERLLSWIRRYPFRCLVCGRRFRAFYFRSHTPKRTEDRQQTVRSVVEIPATFVQTVTLGEERPGTGIVRDLTLGSCSLHTSSPLAVGAVLTLTLQVSPDGSPIEVDVAVVQDVRPTGVELAFLRLQAAAQERLHQYLDPLLAQQTLAAADAESPCGKAPQPPGGP